MQFKSVEEAYMKLADYIQAFIGAREWDEASCHIKIFGKMAQGSQWLYFQDRKIEEGGFEANQNAMWDGLDAALFLRDNLLKTTGERVWGLTFTLQTDGKFNILYDYVKPENYKDSEEIITGDEINESLSRLDHQA